MKILCPLSILLMGVASGAALAQETTDLARAAAHLEAGRIEAALGTFQAVRARRPREVAAHVGVGRCLIRLGRYDRAIQRLEAAESMFPTSARVLCVLGQAYYWDARRMKSSGVRGRAFEIRARLIDAAERCERALRANPKLLEAAYYHGLAELDLGPPEAEAAVKSLNRAAPLKKEDPDYWFFLGTACQQARQFRQAARAFEEAARLYRCHEQARGFCLTAHRRAGANAHRAGDTEAAIRAFVAAYRLDPSHAGTFEALWRLYTDDPKRGDSLVDLHRRLIELDPKQPLPYYYLGFLLERRGERAEARAAFERVVATKTGRGMAEAWAKLGEYAYHDDGLEERAVEHCRRALTCDARNPRAYRLLQTMVSQHIARRSLIRAEVLTRLILDFRPEDGLQWANLGLFLRDQRRYRESHRAYRKAVRFAPDRAQVLNDAAVVLHYHLRRVDEAEKLYSRAVELDPETIDALENLGVVNFDRGRYEAAEKWFRKVLALDPQRGKARRYLARVKRARKAGDPR
jgi:tetratricopeptide (TPR) repeat protein